jgi:hypothetical protein
MAMKRVQLSLDERIVEEWERAAKRDGVPLSTWVKSNVMYAQAFGSILERMVSNLVDIGGDTRTLVRALESSRSEHDS